MSFDAWFEKNWKYGYCTLDQYGKILGSRSENVAFETSSTVKTLILQLFLGRMRIENSPLSRQFAVEEHHLSNGSGIVAYTDWRLLTLENVIDYTCRFSDCVTTNIMIDYLGGAKAINTLVRANQGLTELHLDRLTFDPISEGMPVVASTTPLESARWMSLLKHTTEDTPYQAIVHNGFQVIDKPWFVPFALPIGLKRQDIDFKTGSMIDTDADGLTVMNIVGDVWSGGTYRSFSFFCRGPLRTKEITLTEDEAGINITRIAVKYLGLDL
jgi:hypothetical protein